mgnify:CR=1 FL=1
MARGGSALMWGSVALALIICVTACSDDTGDGSGACSQSGANQLDQRATVSAEDEFGAALKASYVLDVSGLAGGEKTFTVRIRNIANVLLARELTIESVQLVETDSDGAAVDTAAFSCLAADGVACSEATFPSLMPSGFDTACAAADATAVVEMTVRYQQPANVEVRRAELRIVTAGDPDQKDTPLVVQYETALGTPKLTCGSLTDIDFGPLHAGASASETFKCTNVGSAAVRLTHVELFSQDDPPLTISFAEQNVVVGFAYKGSPKVEIEPGQSLEFKASLDKVASEEKIGATLEIHSNDPSGKAIKVRFFANSKGPCLKLEPLAIDFGTVSVGQSDQRELKLVGCGTDVVDVTTIEIVDAESSDDFDISFQTSSFADGEAPSADAPLIVQPNATAIVKVLYAPVQTGATQVGKVRVVHSGGDGELVEKFLDLVAEPGTVVCPTACFEIKTSTNPTAPGSVSVVIPQTKLILKGDCSTAPEGHVVDKWQWTVEQPKGSNQVFVPSDKASPTSFKPDVAGTYVFHLEVFDDLGTPGCSAVQQTLDVVPDNKIHVELTWVTTGDPDPLDDKGSDLDLHVAHPLATGVTGQKDIDGNGEPDPWFAPCYDCYWLNAKPKWGDSSDTDDDAHVDLDDQDGWGPENVSIAWPEVGKKYWIGVYDWIDSGMGPSVPKVRIYLDQQLVFDKKGPEMTTKALWCVAQVAWNPGTVDPATDVQPCPGSDDNGDLLTKGYPSNPTVGSCPP